MVPLGAAALTYGEHRIMGTPGGFADEGGSRGSGGWWGRKTTPGKVEAYTRWSFHFFALVEVAAVGLPLFSQVGAGVAGRLAVLVTVHALLCSAVASRALDWTRGRAGTARTAAVVPRGGDRADRRRRGRPGGAESRRQPGAGRRDHAPGGRAEFRHRHPDARGPRSAARSSRWWRAWSAERCSCSSRWVWPPRPRSSPRSSSSSRSVASPSPPSSPSGFSTPSTNSTRPARPGARLAVAEERLRFGRDLHDVMGATCR
ncbi:hypothetical protein ACRAWF_26765 [Streptomyces sp. L7]